MAILTLTRQAGSLGDEIGMLLARRMGYTYFDRKEIERRIIEKGFSAEKFHKYDERKPRFFDNFARDRDEYLNYLSNVILEMAHENNCIIMGRGSFLLLSGVPGHIPIRFVAEMESRIKHVKELMHIDSDKVARKVIEDSDKKQKQFYKSYFNYDIESHAKVFASINTSMLSPEMYVDMIMTGIEKNETPELQKESETRVGELILAQKISNALFFKHKLPIDDLWVRVKGQQMILFGITSSSAVVERAVTIVNSEFPGHEIISKIRCVQDYRSASKRDFGNTYYKVDVLEGDYSNLKKEGV